LGEARDVLARADHAAMIARRAAKGETGRLRVGVAYCADQIGVSKAVNAFNAVHEGIHVELQTMSVPDQFNALRNHHIDLGFVRTPVTESPLASEILVTEPLVVALPPHHRFANVQSISLSSLAKEIFVLTPRERVPVIHDVILKACREAGFIPDAPHEADHLQLILAMVAEGMGIALVPSSVQKEKHQRITLVTLRPPAPTLEEAIAWRRDDTSPVLKEFVRHAREAF
jgi:DNA-binding transcriptional LysR family regulator